MLARLIVVMSLLFAAGVARARPALVVYPGSFDPTHAAHVVELKTVLDRLRAENADGVTAVVVPNHDRPVHLPKGAGYFFDAERRSRMASLAFGEIEGVRVEPPPDDDLGTVEQLERIVARYGKSHDVHLLVGEDAYRGMVKWEGLSRLRPLLNVIVSVAPERMNSLEGPGEVLGAARHGYRAAGHGRFHDQTNARQIRYLPVSVPEVRSRQILIDLVAGYPPDERLPAAVRRYLATDPAAQRIIQSGLRTAALQLSEDIAPFVGPKAAARFQNPMHARAIFRLRPAPSRAHCGRPRPEMGTAVRRYVQSPAYARFLGRSP